MTYVYYVDLRGSGSKNIIMVSISCESMTLVVIIAVARLLFTESF